MNLERRNMYFHLYVNFTQQNKQKKPGKEKKGTKNRWDREQTVR